MPPKKGLKRKRLAKATTVEEPGSTEEPSPTVEPSTTTTVEPGSTEEPSPTAIEGEQQVLETLSPVLEESDKNEEENSKKNEEEESGEEEEDDKEEEKEEGNEEENEEGEESSSDDGSRSLDRESSSDESKEDEIAPENATENAMEIDEETEAIPPLSMYFPPSEYVKKIKLSTRCYIHEVLTTFDELKPPMSKSERAFFEDHPSFQHVFHMPRDPNHRLMGMWMLLLRTARIDRKKEVWFIVNGDQEEKNQENDGDPKETTQEKDGDPKDTTQEKDGDPQVTKMTTRSKRQLG
ncbi:hypothetical protein ISN44_As06g013600 [Arabidopsis suecica]|uniref:Uncharacterized protein n=1 Tax=Arabidopsis suecica TaxID=45249 RepID=A0A8T2B7S3_ARASU|nr:hypothetical protein ISN44_As12g035330 [Arabidopsis suecica]KAG7548803.1 hypothetical protein ISN44_As12g039550 [Arabidopsis suecica]KAG7564712.1 hypothetical protein ISN44_As10g014650 [Arabidopsis suecica]KAG7572406.1 hypothetical protein ISN44_As09g007700 [Arabidopsis suecica]KAG7572408.1 hypothetical protein ISN44_As09g007720 [Arabidopsis suecica]